MARHGPGKCAAKSAAKFAPIAGGPLEVAVSRLGFCGMVAFA
ncbi:hypothetical protein [Desulfobulbus sp.]|nr:hypothetical protein [Desulfobulbus sp.]